MSIVPSEKDITREQIFSASLDYFLDPIKTFLQDDTVTEIMVNARDQIYVEKNGKPGLSTTTFSSRTCQWFTRFLRSSACLNSWIRSIDQ